MSPPNRTPVPDGHVRMELHISYGPSLRYKSNQMEVPVGVAKERGELMLGQALAAALAVLELEAGPP